MDTTTLVDKQISEGKKFIDQLKHSGITIVVAFWVRTSYDESSFLYIASPIVDLDGPATAYQRVFSELAKGSSDWVSRSDIKLIGSHDATAMDALSYRSPDLPARFGGRRLGDLIIDEAYIYPA